MDHLVIVVVILLKVTLSLVYITMIVVIVLLLLLVQVFYDHSVAFNTNANYRRIKFISNSNSITSISNVVNKKLVVSMHLGHHHDHDDHGDDDDDHDDHELVSIRNRAEPKTFYG